MNPSWHRDHPMPRHATRAQRVAWHRAHQEACACRPVPPALLVTLRAAATRPAAKPALRDLVADGTRHALARGDRALAAIHAQPDRVAELAALTDDGDPRVALRALELLGKLAHEHPGWVAPHKRRFLGPLADEARWEAQLPITRSLPLFAWTPAERRRAIAILERAIASPRTFVRAWARQGLASFARAPAGQEERS